MPASKKRGAPASETVNLRGFTPDEFRALGFAAFKAEVSGKLPSAAKPAAKRVHGGAYLESGALSKVSRRSLQSFVDAIRPFVDTGARQFPESRAAFAKLEARMQSTPGRPAGPVPDLWESRVRDAKRAARELKRGGSAPSRTQLHAAAK